jgi:hypothetical protein
MREILSAAGICLTLLISSCGDKQRILYSCKSSVDAMSCSGSCEKTNMSQTLLLDETSKSLMETTYLDGKQSRSEIINNCSVFNESNWKCERESQAVKQVSKMTNGIYNYYSSIAEKEYIFLCSK